jgi:SAM-dependent methyltransferase
MSTPLEAMVDGPGLFCPDDGIRLARIDATLSCARCRRRYPIHAEDLAEILPSSPAPLDTGVAPSYRRAYVEQFSLTLEEAANASTWGAPETIPSAWVERRRRQATFSISLLLEKRKRGTLLCDVSAGPGYYTIEQADRFDLILHCDLSPDALAYARRRARLSGLTNVLFLRIDYFKPPFRSSIANLVCCDTLIRGEPHELALLAAIRSSLRPGGAAVIDFHNWWHNPARRLGLLPASFGDNHSFSRAEAEALIRRAGIATCEFVPFHQEFAKSTWIARIGTALLPPTRLVYRITAHA